MQARNNLFGQRMRVSRNSARELDGALYFQETLSRGVAATSPRCRRMYGRLFQQTKAKDVDGAPKAVTRAMVACRKWGFPHFPASPANTSTISGLERWDWT